MRKIKEIDTAELQILIFTVSELQIRLDDFFIPNMRYKRVTILPLVRKRGAV